MTNDNNQPLSISSAAVVESSLLAFGAGMSAQNRMDAKNSFLFASLVANRVFDQTASSESWFTSFLQVMGDCGWVLVYRTHEKQSSSDMSLKLANVAVKAVQMAASTLLQSAPVAQVLGVLAEQAIKGLGKDEQALTLFKRSLHNRAQVLVGLASCIETEAGEVVMALGAIQRSARNENLDVLVFDWASASAETYSSTVALSFNSTLYGTVRDNIEERLGDRARTRIMDYVI